MSRSIYVCCLTSVLFWYVFVALGCFYSHQIDVSMSWWSDWSICHRQWKTVWYNWNSGQFVLEPVNSDVCFILVEYGVRHMTVKYDVHNWFVITSSLFISSEDTWQGFSQNCQGRRTCKCGSILPSLKIRSLQHAKLSTRFPAEVHIHWKLISRR